MGSAPILSNSIDAQCENLKVKHDNYRNLW